MTVKLRHVAGGNTMYGWAQPTLSATDSNSYNSYASCIYTSGGTLYGLGTKKIPNLPTSSIPVGATLALRYNPAQGTLHARVNGSAEVLCFSGLANNLVPVVILYGPGDSCVVVDGL
jgi:hypothetical protein